MNAYGVLAFVEGRQVHLTQESVTASTWPAAFGKAVRLLKSSSKLKRGTQVISVKLNRI
jgi:hypothetical protein